MTQPASAPPGLDELLRHLNREGLAVGTRQVLRLHRVLSMEPDLEGGDEADPAFRRLLATALVHSPEEQEIFDRVYGLWQERAEAWERRVKALRAEEEEDSPEVSRAPATGAKPRWLESVRRRRNVWLVALAAVLVGLGLGVVWWWPGAPTPQEEPPSGIIADPDPTPRQDDLKPRPRGEIPETYEEWVPTFTVGGRRGLVAWRSLAPLLLGLFSLAAAWGLWRLFKARPLLPEIRPVPGQPGPRVQPLLPMDPGAPELLDPDSARNLIWGVDRHVTEDLTRELDTDRTIEATAKNAGIPHLTYLRQHRLREVWLWCDGGVDDPALETFCEEIRHTLEKAGLAVRLGGFDGYPYELAWEEGQVFRPLDVEGRRQTALVAVCTDGRALVDGGAAERGEIQTLLRSLALWPRLAFVDFAAGETGLAGAVAPYGLPCLLPPELAPYFGLESLPPKEREAQDPAELRGWAAALALSPRPVDRPTAYALRRELGLAVSPWALRHLARGDLDGHDGDPGGETPVLGNNLSWSTETRARLLRWFLDSQDVRDGRALRRGTLLERALAFWERRLDHEEAARQERQPMERWQDHAPQRHLKMERCLLRLWRRPEVAARQLAALREEGEAEHIRLQLDKFTLRDAAGDHLIHLPWKAADLSPGTLSLLQQLGMAGLEEGRGPPPGRLVTALGVLVGAGVAVLSGILPGAFSPPEDDVFPVQVASELRPPAGAHAFHAATVQVGERAWAGTPRSVVSVVAEGGPVTLTWKREQRDCITAMGASQLWRCGRGWQAPDPPQAGQHVPRPLTPTTREAMAWPRRSLGLLLFPTDDGEARRLAATLLETGTVDALLLGPDAAELLRRGALLEAGAGEEADQLLVIQEPLGPEPEIPAALQRWVLLSGADLPALATHLTSLEGGGTVGEVWADFYRSGDPTLRVANCPYQEAIHEDTGMVLVKVCAGSFTMGSDDSDPEAYPDETPAHNVGFRRGFWIGKHEVTVGEFTERSPNDRIYRPEAGQDSWPVQGVTWDEARGFCRSLGESAEWEYDLASEAEWEYAARGYSGRRYPWGQEEPDETRARFGREPRGVPASVGAYPAGEGPFGTLDQAGNVWEWVVDCYERDYEKLRREPDLINDDCSSSGLRVLRGGAFWDVPRLLRSAYRDGLEPRRRDGDFGFRCVRRPRPQLDPLTP